MTHAEPVLFALDASRGFGKSVGRLLGVELSPHEEREFEDGEHKARPLTSVRGSDVFVIQSLDVAGPQRPAVQCALARQTPADVAACGFEALSGVGFLARHVRHRFPALQPRACLP